MSENQANARSIVNRPGTGLLRLAVAAEGATLVLLVGLAVPVKLLLDLPLATKIMGPIHGVAFLFLLYALTEAYAARAIGRTAILRLTAGALVPFGGFYNEKWLRNYKVPDDV